MLLVTIWFVIATAMMFLARENFKSPGLFYDEAAFGGLAKDFLTGETYGRHYPDHQVINFFGRPFPLFMQRYAGAVKSWMLLPTLPVLGFTPQALRATSLCWSLVAMLALMVGIWHCIGASGAILTALLLSFDPTYFFLSIWDWGSFVPLFFCRCACLYFATVCATKFRLRYAFAAGFFAGLGIFAKIEFSVFLIAVAIAAFALYRKEIAAFLQTRSRLALLGAIGFLVGSGPMLIKLSSVLGQTSAVIRGTGANEWLEKLRTFVTMYDGSYFFRLMDSGGLFNKMYDSGARLLPIFGLLVLLSVIILLINSRQDHSVLGSRVPMFVVFIGFLTTAGVFLFPGASRLHHLALTIPVPHLLIALALISEWNAKAGRRLRRALVIATAVALLCANSVALYETKRLLRETNGRGWWSDTVNRFAEENARRSDLTIVSLDWGFNEQLLFLTRGPRLLEPFWTFGNELPSLNKKPEYIYLVHPPSYSLLGYDQFYLKKARETQNAEITPFADKEGQIAFYAIRFRQR